MAPERDHAGLSGLLRPGWPGKRARLATLVGRFRPQIEYDLRTEAGLSLGELWQERRWRELLNIIEHLPPNSVTQEAIANDEELAEAMIAAAGGELPEARSKNPSLRGWTQEASLLAQAITELRQQTAVLIRTNSKKGSAQPKIAPVLVPVTAFQRVLEKHRLERRLVKHQSLVRRLLGDRAAKK